MEPLLSICIPTHNRCHLLKVMLQALLPQAQRENSRVEVLVSDNASSDGTQRLIEESGSVYPICYSQNDSNIGPIENILRLTTELARGEFIWLLGDDDLLRPGALRRVLSTIEAHQQLNAIYFNFYCADYGTHWPSEAHGGYRGSFKRIANSRVEDGALDEWQELISSESWMCTQMYAHVVRRKIWKEYWPGRQPGANHSDILGTYPHSCMLAETMMHSPSYYVGEPILTIFDGAESWTGISRRIHLLRNPELLIFYQQLGLSKERFNECASAVFSQCRPFLAEQLTARTGADPTIGDYLASNWRFPDAWRALLWAMYSARQPSLIGRILSAAATLRRMVG